MGRIDIRSAELYAAQGNFGHALEVLEPLVRRPHDGSPPEQVLLAEVLHRCGRSTDANIVATAVIASRTADAESRARALLVLGQAAYVAGSPSDAAEHHAFQAVEVVEAVVGGFADGGEESVPGVLAANAQQLAQGKRGQTATGCVISSWSTTGPRCTPTCSFCKQKTAYDIVM